jgi:hypothetical protein
MLPPFIKVLVIKERGIFMDKNIAVIVNLPISYEVLDNIIVSAFEGGIGYWACLDNTTDDFEQYYSINEQIKSMKPDDYYNHPHFKTTSDIVRELLLESKSITLEDAEDDSQKWVLTLEMLKKGIELWLLINGGNINNIDSNDADGIVQYAVFGELTFG